MLINSEGDALKHHFVLIHGIGGGSWCWYKIRCLLENSGHKVTTLDLKSAGIHTSDPNSILTFDDYNSPLTDFLKSLPQDEKVILVGHSAGGLSVTAATQKFSNKISVAVYVCATMLKNGLRTELDKKDLVMKGKMVIWNIENAEQWNLRIMLNEMCLTSRSPLRVLFTWKKNGANYKDVTDYEDEQGVPELSEYGDIHEFGFGFGADKAPTSAMIKKEFQRKIIYNMSPQEDCTLAGMVSRPGPIVAIRSAQFDDADDEVEKVPRVYIKAEYDRVLKPEQQDALIRRWPPASVYSLESDHSPFFSTPFMLCGLLIKTADTLVYSNKVRKQ